ncbi:hypothetical protein CYPRO_0431 [Cyclonatronum proteinivorum]|uniref:Uncharacterized protein n=1 Tax=Cyclonatronum proteinivorum TaxID=1457365 RepID=A0A345UGW6_9BACT|nr:hypothetical protein [Cyclonatronum proteinivorum]AXI99717.1 hypothetical protein CYPRO_0431 [Cyclonatronum proteinivorum]
MDRSENHIQSALKYPLSSILGSKGHIAVLRELFSAGYPLGHGSLLERTGLSRQGVYDVVKRLAETGIVAYQGSGRQQLIALRSDYPLYMQLKAMFFAEADRFDNLLQALGQIIEGLSVRPDSAWIFGSVAAGTDRYGDALQIALLGRLSSIENVAQEFSVELSKKNTEITFDVSIESRGITKADLMTKPYFTEGTIIHLWGVHPLSDNISSGSGHPKCHQEIDQTQASDSKIWSELLALYPEIIPRTIRYLEQEIPKHRTGEKLELDEWKRILMTTPFQRLKKLLESDSERAIRLRQSLPFWPVLTEDERAMFMSLKGQKSGV